LTASGPGGTIVAMTTPLACVVCSVDPQTSSLLLPIAQATIIAAPILLRDEIRRRVRAFHERGLGLRPHISSGGRPAEPDTGAEGDR
jgi:hypothetical protein